jgi:excisionase family DNA binding protein
MEAVNEGPLRNLPQAAKRLGVSVTCLRRWIFLRTIPYIKIGRAVRISDQTIDEIILRGTRPALVEAPEFHQEERGE